MMRQRQAFNTLALWLLTVLLTVSCQPHHKKPQLTTQQLAYNDSLIYAAMDRDYNEALLVIDSLEDVHALYDAKVSFYRAQVYFKMGQELSAELYYKKALADDALREESSDIIFFAYDQLSTILTIKGDQQGSLATATEGYAKAQEDNSEMGQHWQSILLHDIGYCQMQLGRIEEAEKNFTHAFNTLKRLALQKNKYDDIYAWARVSYNIMDAYTSTSNFDAAEKWVIAAEEAINKLVNGPVQAGAGGLSAISALPLLQHQHRTGGQLGVSGDCRTVERPGQPDAPTRLAGYGMGNAQIDVLPEELPRARLQRLQEVGPAGGSTQDCPTHSRLRRLYRQLRA